MNMGVAYEKQKDYIKNLYKNEDYMTLEKVFRPYFKMMQKSLQKNDSLQRMRRSLIFI